MVSFTQLIATAIATAAFVVAAPTPAATVISETALLQIVAVDAYGIGVVTANGTYVFSGGVEATFTIERDPSNTNNLLITSPLGPCGMVANVFVCSATTTPVSFGFESLTPGTGLTNGGPINYNGASFSLENSGALVADNAGGEYLTVLSQ